MKRNVEASNVVPSFVNSGVSENVLKEVAGNVPKSNLLKNLPRKEEGRVKKILESLNLQGIESWTEQQQQSARNLIREYQNLFALNLSELGRNSLVQHDIKLDDMMPFKEQYRKIPPHQ